MSEPYGSWNPNGWRVGVDPTTEKRPFPSSGRNSLLNWGYGVIQSPIFCYRINLPDLTSAGNYLCPFQPVNNGGGWLGQNTVKETFPQQFQLQPIYGGPFPVPYAIAGQGGATYNSRPTDVYLQENAEGALRNQFYWPTTVNIVCNDIQSPSAGRAATVFGYDWYSQPMQEKIDMSAGVVNYRGKKAFWGVTGVFINQALTDPENDLVSVQNSTTLGLPWVLSELGDFIYYTQDGQPGADLAGFAYVPYETLPSTATNGDTRGTFTLADSETRVRNVAFTYYVNGASPWQTMMSEYQRNNPTTFPQGLIINPAGVNETYGEVPYYSGQVE